MEAFAYMDDVSLGLTRITADMVRAFAFLRQELQDIGIVVNPAKTVALPPKGHAPTAEEISLVESVDVSITGEGGATVVGVPIGTDEYVLDRAMEVVRDGGADRLARCLANMPDKQAAALIAIEPSGRGQVTWKGLWTRGCHRNMQKSRQRSALGVRKDPGATWSGGGTVAFPGGVPR